MTFLEQFLSLKICSTLFVFHFDFIINGRHTTGQFDNQIGNQSDNQIGNQVFASVYSPHDANIYLGEFTLIRYTVLHLLL